MSVEVFDLECDSANPHKANLKFYGTMNIDSEDINIFSDKQNIQIADKFTTTKIFIGFNSKSYDMTVLENHGFTTKYKANVDLYQILAPKGDIGGFGQHNKGRLHDINPGLKLKNYKLKTIIAALGLDTDGNKGDVDYDIFKKDTETLKKEEKLNPKKLYKKIISKYYTPQKQTKNKPIKKPKPTKNKSFRQF